MHAEAGSARNPQRNGVFLGRDAGHCGRFDRESEFSVGRWRGDLGGTAEELVRLLEAMLDRLVERGSHAASHEVFYREKIWCCGRLCHGNECDMSQSACRD